MKLIGISVSYHRIGTRPVNYNRCSAVAYIDVFYWKYILISQSFDLIGLFDCYIDILKSIRNARLVSPTAMCAYAYGRCFAMAPKNVAVH